MTCTSSLEDLIEGYSHYAPLWDSNCDHILEGVRSQMKPAGWRSMLSGGPTNMYGVDTWDFDSHFLLDGMLHGFKLVDPDSPIDPYSTKNYVKSDALDFIDSLIEEELAAGKLSVVSDPPTCIHAMGAVDKKGGGFRPITDASRPEGRSINSFMQETFHHFSYSSIDDVVKVLEPGMYMSVSDVSSAYRSIMIRPSDREYQGLEWEVHGKPTFLVDNFLSFGTRMAAFLFNRITDSITRYMRSHGYTCFNYLDDLLVLGRSFSECQAGQLFLHSTLRSLGFYIAYKKVLSPSQVQVYLGVEIDSLTMELRLPRDKLAKLHTELLFFAGRRRATRKQLRRLCGVLAHCSTLVRGGRTFSHRIIAMLSAFTGGKRYITLSTAFFEDLDWWQRFASWFNGSANIIAATPQACADLYMDASGVGYGVHYGTDWLCAGWYCDLSMNIDYHNHCLPCPDVFVPDNINVQELFPILMAIQRWGPSWRDRKVICFSDNTHVVSALNKGKSANKHAMTFLRQLFWLSVLYNCQLTAVHIAGKLNVVADALSRVLLPPHNLPLFICCSGEQPRGRARRPGGRDPSARVECRDMED